ncbi:MAG: hypothetical protein K2H34_04460 [Lachnospiraceae bacterium]|nr:hypothetical protein [Lachnospiraceae bacterium]
MQETINFNRSMGLTVILTIAAVFSSKQPYMCLLLAGILMVMFTVESISDSEQNILLQLGKTFLVAIFAVFSGHFMIFLLFYECRFGKREFWQITPGIFCAIWEMAAGKKQLPYIICEVLILELAVCALRLVEEVFHRVFLTNRKVEESIQITAINEMYEKKLNHELQLKNYLLDKNARLEERENISRNIHNSVGHSVTAAIMTLEAADMLFLEEPERAREKMNIAKERVSESLESIRHAVRVLDVENGVVSGSDFIKEVLDITENFVMDTAIIIRKDVTAFPPEFQIPHEHAEFLTGAVQELLTNGVRHGRADTFTLHISGDSGHVKVRIQDNGVSDFNENNAGEKIARGFGMKKLIAYVQRCGGKIQYRNENGFVTEIELPILAEEIGDK